MGRSARGRPTLIRRKPSVRDASLLFHRDFRLLWAGDAISQFGTMVTMLALPLVAVTTLSASAFEVGLLTTFERLAFLLVGLPAGAWVDRMRRRNVMIATDVGRALLLASLPLAAFLDRLTITQLYVVALLNGMLTVFFDVAYQSYLPSLVGREHLVEGNAKLQGVQSVAQLSGPSVGGALVQALTAPYALLVDAVSFLWSAGCVGAIRHREPEPEAVPGRHLGREIAEGLSFVLRHRLLRAIAACTGTFNLFASGMTAMLIILLARDLDLSAGLIGLLFSIEALGGLLGALYARRIAARVGEGPAIWLSTALSAPLNLVLPFLQANWTLAVMAVTGVGVGVGMVVYNVTQVSFRQALCPDHLLGRMNATMRFLVWGTMPLGGLLGGVLGSLFGVRQAIFVCVVGSILSFLPVYFSPLRTMTTLPTRPDPPDPGTPAHAATDPDKPDQGDAVSEGGVPAVT